MKKLCIRALFLSATYFFSLSLYSAAGAPCGNYLSDDGLVKGECDEAYVNPKDTASLQRGAQIYMNYCLGCHSLKYARYKRVSEDLEIPLDMFAENLLLEIKRWETLFRQEWILQKPSNGLETHHLI